MNNKLKEKLGYYALLFIIGSSITMNIAGQIHAFSIIKTLSFINLAAYVLGFVIVDVLLITLTIECVRSAVNRINAKSTDAK